jgi:hypothetical protein
MRARRQVIEFPTVQSMHRWLEDNVLPTDQELEELNHLFAKSPFGARRREDPVIN